MKPQPFAFPNGIFREKRLQALKEKAGGDRNECKRYIQKKYFGYGDADFNVPIFTQSSYSLRSYDFLRSNKH